MWRIALLLSIFVASSAAADDVRPLKLWTLQWRVPIAPFVLGSTPFLDVELVAKTADGHAITGVPELKVSTGTLADLQQIEAGVWRARYEPPTERFPHIAVLSARIDAADVVYVAYETIKLWGKGRLKIKTDPQAKVTVRIGQNDFGPVRADRHGLALVDVKSPPGPMRATAHSTDLAGNISTEQVGLGVPAFNRLALFELQEYVVADGSGALELIAFVSDKKGVPLFDADLLVTASPGGELSKPVALSAGVYRVVYRPAPTTEKVAVVEVRLRGDEASVATSSTPFLAGAASEVTFSAPPVVAARVARTTIDVVVRDRAGSPVTTRAISFFPSSGTVTRSEISDGKVQLTWTIPTPQMDTPPVLSVVDKTGNKLAQFTPVIESGPPASIEIDDIAPMVGDGKTTRTVRVRLLDGAGNALSPERLAFTFGGAFLPAEVSATAAQVELLAPVADIARRVVFSASAFDLVAERKVAISVRPIPRMSTTFSLRQDWNYGETVQFGPEARFRLRAPFLWRGAQLGVSAAYLHTAFGRRHAALPMALSLSHDWSFADGWSAAGGGEAGVLMSDLDVGGTRNIAFAPLAAAFADIRYRLGPGEISGRIRVGASWRFSSPPVPLGAGLAVGYRVLF